MGDSRQTLLDAIAALYHHPDESVKKQANRWLEEWRHNVEAWTLSDSVLHESGNSMEVQYFCAQTLRTKLQTEFEELPETAVNSLRESLLGLLVQFYAGPGPVRTQLCLAIAALIAHLPATQWGDGGAVHWLSQRLGAAGQAVAVPCLLEMLTVLPQEAGANMPAVRPDRRRQMHGEMIGSAPLALEILSSCLQQQGGQATEQVLRSFTEWLKLKPGAGLDGATLAQHPLVTAALQGLQSAQTFDASVEALCELIYCTVDSQGPLPGMDPLIQRLVPAVLALHPRFVVVMQRAIAIANGTDEQETEAAVLDDDEDTAKGLARLFAELGEAYTPLIATGTDQAMAPVHVLLDVAAYPDASICQISFTFWHRLAHRLTSGFSQPEPLDEAEKEPTHAPGYEYEQRLAKFRTPFMKLVALIRGRVRYPDDFDSWHKDEKLDFRRSRYAVADTLVDAAGVLGGEVMLQLLVEPLHELAKQQSSGQEFDWRSAEASLYCIRSVHRDTVDPGHPLLVALLQSFAQLPHVGELQYTACLTIGAYASWIAATQKLQPDSTLLPEMLQVLTRGLLDGKSAAGAALALRHLCSDCRSLLGPYMESLLSGVYTQIHTAGAVASLVPSPQLIPLSEDDVQQLIEAFTLGVCVMPAEKRTAALNTLMAPVVQPLVAVMDATPAGQTPANDHVLPYIHRLTVIFRYMPQPDLVAEALALMWGLLEKLLERCAGDMALMEQLCRVPRYALRNARKAASRLVPMLLTWLPRWFAATRHSSFLYVSSEVIKTFGSDQEYSVALSELLQSLVMESCSQLRSIQQFDERPDLADDTFLLASRALNYAPQSVFTAQLLPILLETAEKGLLVQHREACRSVLDFLAKLFNGAAVPIEGTPPDAGQILEAALRQRGHTLFRLLLAGVAGALPTPRVTDIAETMHIMLKTSHETGYQWLAQAASTIPASVGSKDEVARLLQVALKTAQQGTAANNLSDLENALDDLSEVCRRNKRSLDESQRALAPELQLVPGR